MCDENPVLAALYAAAALIAAAISFIILAIALNWSFLGAPASSAVMAAAGAFSAAASISLMVARSAALAYYNCFGGLDSDIGQNCAGDLNNFLNALAGLTAVMLAQALACFGAAGLAWIPWVGSAPMWSILGALILQGAMIPLLILYYDRLRRCLTS